MSTPNEVASSSYARKRTIGLLLVLLGGLICLVHAYSIRNKIPHFIAIDFRAVYGSCRCVIAGCNPYYFEDMRTQFLKQGGTVAEALTPAYGPFMPYFVGYPPTTMFYLAPFALFRWPLGMHVYLGVAITLYAVALTLFADLSSEYVPIAANACLGVFLAVQKRIVFLSQPTLLAAALLCIGVWCLLKNRYPRLGVLCFALSLLLKPPLGGLFLLYFLVATPNYRKRALQVIGVTIVLCLPVLLWFSTHAAMRNWVQDYRNNLTHITAPGNLSDPGPRINDPEITSLQTLVSLYRDEPKFYNRVVAIFSAVVIAVWLYPAIRRKPSQEKDILCIAAIAAFSMLPVYHRVYDSRALLILFPAFALLLQRTAWWGKVAGLLTLTLSLVLADWYSSRVHVGSPLVQRFANHHLLQIMLVHISPILFLSITICYLVILYVSPPSLELKERVVPVYAYPQVAERFADRT